MNVFSISDPCSSSALLARLANACNRSCRAATLLSLATDDDDDDDMLLAAALIKEVDAVHECLWLLMSRFDEEDHEKHSEIGTSNSSEQQQQGNTDNNEYIVTRRRIQIVRGVNKLE